MRPGPRTANKHGSMRADEVSNSVPTHTDPVSEARTMSELEAAELAQHEMSRAERMAAQGELSKAVGFVAGERGICEIDGAALGKLKTKHPDRTEAWERSFDVRPHLLTAQQVRDGINSLPNRRASDNFGYTYEFFKAIIRAGGLSCMHAIVDGIACGCPLPPEVRPFFSGGNLIALYKEDNDMRPLTIGCTVRRICAHSLCGAFSKDFADRLAPQQFGVGIRGGCFTMANEIRFLLDSNPDWGAATIDSKNAFNCVKRAAIHKALKEHFPHLLPFFDLTYGDCGYITVRMKRSPFDASIITESLLSAEGCQQGDPLGSFFFCLAIADILAACEVRFAVRVLAYVDDIIVLGPPEIVKSAFVWLRNELAGKNLIVQEKKCATFWATDHELLHDVKHSKLGFLAIKLPFGYSDYMIENADKCIIKKVCTPLRKIADWIWRNGEADTNSWLHVIRHIITCSAAYCFRAIPPSAAAHGAALASTSLRAAIGALVKQIDLPDAAWTQACLPRGPGLGVPNPESYSLDCFASCVHSFVHAACWPQHISEAIGTVLHGSTPFAGVIAASLDRIRSLPSANLLILKTTHLSRFADVRVAAVMRSVSGAEQARLKTLATPFANSWLLGFGNNPTTAWDGPVFSVALCRYLNLPPCSLSATQCLCGAPMPEPADKDHMFTCGRLGGIVLRHDAVRNMTAALMTAAGVPRQMEVDGLLDGRLRIDILRTEPKPELALDVTVHSISATSVSRAVDAGYKDKIKKYDAQCLEHHLTFLPLAFDDLGCVTASTMEFYDSLFARIPTDPDVHVLGLSPVSVKTYWTALLSTTLWRGTANAVCKLSHGSITAAQGAAKPPARPLA